MYRALLLGGYTQTLALLLGQQHAAASAARAAGCVPTYCDLEGCTRVHISHVAGTAQLTQWSWCVAVAVCTSHIVMVLTVASLLLWQSHRGILYTTAE